MACTLARRGDRAGSALTAWIGIAEFCGHACRPLLQRDGHWAGVRGGWGWNSCTCMQSLEQWTHNDLRSGNMLVTEQVRAGMAWLNWRCHGTEHLPATGWSLG